MAFYTDQIIRFCFPRDPMLHLLEAFEGHDKLVLDAGTSQREVALARWSVKRETPIDSICFFCPNPKCKKRCTMLACVMVTSKPRWGCQECVGWNRRPRKRGQPKLRPMEEPPIKIVVPPRERVEKTV